MKTIANQRASLFKRSAMVFALTIIVTLYWYLSWLINVYFFPVIGAINEILWIFMIAGLFALPLISFIFWAKTKFNFRSLYFYSLLVSLVSITFFLTRR